MKQHKPLPIIDNDSQEFWKGCQENKLLIQKCSECNNVQFYPRIICTNCMSEQLEWIEATGQGEIYSFTIAHRPASPAFADDVPYAIALVDLDEGVRMMTNIIDIDVEQVTCGLKVEVSYEERGGMKLPNFKPIKVKGDV